jgi:cystathionine beta-lyase/cystathionine gamma-synthase
LTLLQAVPEAEQAACQQQAGGGLFCFSFCRRFYPATSFLQKIAYFLVLLSCQQGGVRARMRTCRRSFCSTVRLSPAGR